MNAYINAIGTAVPKLDFQGIFPDLMGEFLGINSALIRRLTRTMGIGHRYSVLPFKKGDNFYQRPDDPNFLPDTSLRMEMYKKTAPILALEAVKKIVTPEILEKITHVVIGSCTGFYAPGLDLDVIRMLGLPHTTKRRIIGFMGCFAGLTVLETASDIVGSDPEAMVLTINLELSSLHFQKPKEGEDKGKKLLGFAQFADGGAAAIVSSKPLGLKITAFQSEIFPRYERSITWDITEQGFVMGLDTNIAAILRDEIIPKMTNLPKGNDRQDFLFAVHPGGKAILDAVEEGLGLMSSQIRASRNTLRDFGNMSSATIFFVLKEIMDSNWMNGGIAMAFGPGIAVEMMKFKKVS